MQATIELVIKNKKFIGLLPSDVSKGSFEMYAKQWPYLKTFLYFRFIRSCKSRFARFGKKN